MKLAGLLFDNLGLKVLALGMAWAVWFMVSQSLSDEQPVPIDLRIHAPDDFRVTPIEPATLTTITVKIAGPARTVADFRSVAMGAEAVIDLGPEHQPAESDHALLTLEDVRIPELERFPGLRAVSMLPETIRVNVERMAVREITVMRPKVELDIPTVEARVVAWDNVVKVRAPAAHFHKRLVTLETSVDPEVLRQHAASLGEAPSVPVEVDLIVNELQAPLFELVGQDRISARLTLTQVAEDAFLVPVRIFRTQDGPGGGARPLRFMAGNQMDLTVKDVYVPGLDGAPPSVRLVLVGSPAAIANVDIAQLRAFVLADEMPADGEFAKLAVYVAGLPGGVRPKRQIALAVEREP